MNALLNEYDLRAVAALRSVRLGDGSLRQSNVAHRACIADLSAPLATYDLMPKIGNAIFGTKLRD